jgi:hypothetical protein
MVKSDNLPVQQNDNFVVQADIDPLILQAEKVYVALRNWRTYEELPRELGSVNYTECIKAVKNKLIPIPLADARGIIITFVNTCKAFGWISDPATLGTICDMYYETLSHLPEEFFRDALRIVLKTWTHGQYLKMPSPAFLKESIPSEYYRLHHVKQKLEVAQMVSNREKKRKKPSEDQNLVRFDPALYVPFMKKVEE